MLDAGTGPPGSLNREARRILAGLELKGGSPESLREAVVCRRGDGRETNLADLADPEIVRAEEVEISAPGGVPGAGDHEPRMPLAVIRGSASMALEDPRDPNRDELRQYLRIVEEQAGRMSGLIRDLLDAGRIGAGTLTVDPAPEALAGIVERARRAFAGGGARHAVTVEVPEGLRVLADTRRVVQMLSNLFDNAARHSVETAPILVSAPHEGAEGIAPECLSHPFHRHAGTGVRGDSGLGLVICKRLVDAHGGRIRAESAGLARGTAVTFTLPAAEEKRRGTPGADRGARVHARAGGGGRPARDALVAAGYEPATTAE